MTEKEDKNIEQVVEEAESTDSPAENDDAAEIPETRVPVAPAPPAPRKSSSLIGWLALLLVLALAGGGAWYLQDTKQREAALLQRLSEIELAASREDDRLEQAGQRWESQLQQGLAALREESEGQAEVALALEEELSAVRSELSRGIDHHRLNKSVADSVDMRDPVAQRRSPQASLGIDGCSIGRTLGRHNV